MLFLLIFGNFIFEIFSIWAVQQNFNNYHGRFALYLKENFGILSFLGTCEKNSTGQF